MAELTFDYVEGRRKPKKETRMDRIKRAEIEAPQRIAERGDIWSGIGRDIKNVVGGGKEGKWEQAKDIGKLALSGLSAPVQMVEGAIAGPALEIQKDPMRSLTTPMGMLERGKESVLGLAGIKQPKFEDVYLGAGMTETGAKLAGLGTTLAIPVAVVNKLSKTMGAISTVTDKKLEGASKLAVDATKTGGKILGGSVDDAYAPVDDVLGDISAFKKAFKGTHEVIKNAFIKKFGEIDDWAEVPIKRVREMKQWLGKLRRTSWGKDAKGFEEGLIDDYANTLYSSLKGIIRKASESKLGKEGAKLIDDADDVYSRFLDAANVIKRGVVDPQLPKEFTKGAMFARQLMGVKGTARKASEIIRKAGPEAAKQMKEAVRLLKRFEKLRLAAKGAKGLLKGAAIGGGFAGISRLMGGKSQGGTTVVEPKKE